MPCIRAVRKQSRKTKSTRVSQALVVDIGNTSVSAAVADVEKGRLLRKIRVPLSASRNEVRDILRKLLQSRACRPSRAVLAAVVPADVWRQELERALGSPALEVGPKLRLGFSLGAYPKPGTIGPDRLADAAAAIRRFGAPAVTVNCGTATVLNAVDAKGLFLGGMILPGAPLFLDYLSERTARLPRLRWREESSGVAVIGRSTVQAMRAGSVFGFAGMLEAAIQQTCQALGENKVPVCVTGGYSGGLAGQLALPVFFDQDLTLLGLCRIFALNI